MRKVKKNPDNCNERCGSCGNRFSCRKRALIGYEKLAFGSTADAFRLLMNADSDVDISSLDLYNVAEIKKPKDGAMEIKFFDRLKALEQLGDIPSSEDGAATFFDAISRSAKELGVKRNDS